MQEIAKNWLKFKEDSEELVITYTFDPLVDENVYEEHEHDYYMELCNVAEVLEKEFGFTDMYNEENKLIIDNVISHLKEEYVQDYIYEYYYDNALEKANWQW